MKRITSLLLVIAFTGMILLPVAGAVKTASSYGDYIADGGVPVPPPIPCAVGGPNDLQLS
jgi:hypothetical protein